jgi:hypothetical protein
MQMRGEDCRVVINIKIIEKALSLSYVAYVTVF